MKCCVAVGGGARNGEMDIQNAYVKFPMSKTISYPEPFDLNIEYGVDQCIH